MLRHYPTPYIHQRLDARRGFSTSWFFDVPVFPAFAADCSSVTWASHRLLSVFESGRTCVVFHVSYPEVHRHPRKVGVSGSIIRALGGVFARFRTVQLLRSENDLQHSEQGINSWCPGTSLYRSSKELLSPITTRCDKLPRQGAGSMTRRISGGYRNRVSLAVFMNEKHAVTTYCTPGSKFTQRRLRYSYSICRSHTHGRNRFRYAGVLPLNEAEITGKLIVIRFISPTLRTHVIVRISIISSLSSALKHKCSDISLFALRASSRTRVVVFGTTARALTRAWIVSAWFK